MKYLIVIALSLLANFAFGQENYDYVKNSVRADLEAGRLPERLDETVDHVIKATTKALRDRGYPLDAKKIDYEYQRYAYFLSSQKGDIGDYEPWLDWMVKVHAKAHEKLGDFACQFLHVHDLYIITYGVPVVMAPEKYSLDTYQNHFTGVHIIGPFWKHYGLAPVIVYWAVSVACGAVSSGAAVLACSPIASSIEDVFGIYVSPPLGKKLWTSAQN